MVAIAAVQREPILKHLSQLLGISIIHVVPLSFARQVGLHRVVEIVAPLGVQTIATPVFGKEKTHIVQITFSHDVGRIGICSSQKAC